MPKHLQRELEHLKTEVLAMGAMVEQSVDKAIEALVERKLPLAEEVMRSDDRMDQKEVQVEEECLKALALHQPVAADLRFIITVLKVNNDLERMGDLASHIAERAAFLSSHEPLQVPHDLTEMADRVRRMVRESLEALVNHNTILARQICSQDDTVDSTHRAMYQTIQDLMRKDPQNVERAMHTLSASRYLERIADYATNIAEDVIFMVEGEIARHRPDRLGSPRKT
ncbi:MAG: phosphate signaling complex protein PhoU [Planctomycetales bacterium]|nr:phosphate signaling complex protein PhoU [Planctomycetales bacterium]